MINRRADSRKAAIEVQKSSFGRSTRARRGSRVVEMEVYSRNNGAGTVKSSIQWNLPIK